MQNSSNTRKQNPSKQCKKIAAKGEGLQLSNKVLQRKKIVPASIHIEEQLIARGLAYWYMDDGSAKWQNKTKAMRLCTDSFSEDDVLKLITVLEKKFGIKSKLYKETPKRLQEGKTAKTKIRIAIGAHQHTLITLLSFNFLHKSMIHKYPYGSKIAEHRADLKGED